MGIGVCGNDAMRAHYQMGNDNVHAGVKSMYLRLGLQMESDSLLAGRSNAGLTDPAQSAAFTLTQIAVLVCSTKEFDDIVVAHMMCQLRDEIPLSFWTPEEQLKKKHLAFLQSQSE